MGGTALGGLGAVGVRAFGLFKASGYIQGFTVYSRCIQGFRDDSRVEGAFKDFEVRAFAVMGVPFSTSRFGGFLIFERL